MATKRQSKKVTLNVTQQQAEEALAQYAKATSKIDAINAKMELAMTKIREANQSELSELAALRDESFAIIEAFAVENRDELFTKKKSLDLVHGTIGFRSGNPQLKNRKGFTWSAVVEMLKEFLPAYVRTKSEPDKEKLLADRDAPEVADKFEKCGICVVQDQAFFIETKKEE